VLLGQSYDLTHDIQQCIFCGRFDHVTGEMIANTSIGGFDLHGTDMLISPRHRRIFHRVVVLQAEFLELNVDVLSAFSRFSFSFDAEVEFFVRIVVISGSHFDSEEMNLLNHFDV